MKIKCRSCNGEIDNQNLGAIIDYLKDELCSNCKLDLSCREGITLQEVIDKQIAPIIVLDQEGLVQTVNEKARELFNQTLYYFRGKTVGKVFECKYAQLPEGCGKTVHCSSCSIRLAISETFTSGKPVTRMGATLKSLGSGEQQEIHYYISTMKRRDAVILQIDDRTYKK